MKEMIRLFALVVIVAWGNPAQAYDWAIEAKVLLIEPSYVPTSVVFQIDGSIGQCPIGSWLTWFAKGTSEGAKIANVQAILSVLTIAKVTGTKVRIHGNNAGCTIDYMHFI